MEYIHADFLASPEAYEAAQGFWRALWQEAQLQHYLDWRSPWLQEPSVALRDGNPISPLGLLGCDEG